MIEIKNLNVTFDEDIFKDASLSIPKGAFNVLIGESGIGKTTLLSKLGLLSTLDFDYVIDERKITKKDSLSQIRAEMIGYVFQENQLLEKLTVKENLIYAAQISGKDLTEDEVDHLLSQTYIEDLKDREIRTLSGGEKQRVAISFALAKKPKLLLLDEPTSYLDHDNCEQIIDIIKNIVSKGESYIFVASHDQRLLSAADNKYKIEDCNIKQPSLDASALATSHDTEERDHRFHKQAISHYIDVSRQKIKHLISIITLIVLTLFFSVYCYRNYYRVDFLNNTINSSKEEIRLYYGPSKLKAAGEVTRTMDTDVRRGIMDLEGIDTLIPFYEEIGEVGKMTVAIQSYENLSSRVSQTIDEDGDVYVSYNLSKMVKNGKIKVKTNDGDRTFKVAGVLEKDHVNDYSDTSDYVVYLPNGTYTDMLKLSGVKVKMYIIKFAKNVNYLDIVNKVTIIDDELTVYSKIPLESMNLINNSTLNNINNIVYLFGICALAMIVYERFKSISNRQYELGLLYANGCSFKDIIYIVIMEPIKLFAVLVNLAVLISGIFTAIVFNMNMTRILLLLLLGVIAFVVLELTSLLAGYFVLKSHSIKQLLFE